MRHWRVAAVSLLTLGPVLLTGASAVASPARHAAFPTEIALPDGFRPEGITIRGTQAYLGSLADGDIYRADLRTGAGRVISQGPGTPSVGLKIDHRGLLFVAGGVAGTGRVVDSRTGRILRSYQFADPATGETFVNDVKLAWGAAWFTDSRRPVLYKVPLGWGALPPSSFKTLNLTGVEYVPGQNNANGIETTPDGRALIVVQSNLGRLMRVNPVTGAVTIVQLAGGESVPNGDGLLLRGRTLYVVQNRLNLVAEVRLNSSGTAGTVVRRIADPRFDVPTTVAAFGHRLYLPNARFTTTPTPETPYNVVAISVR
jgi:sugar lactone lactonase YvrE